MKLFWTIIAIFALAAAGMVWAQGRAGQGGSMVVREPDASTYAPAASGVPGDDPLIARTPPQQVNALAGGSRESREKDATRQVDADAPGEAESEDAEQKGDGLAHDDLAQNLIEDLLGEEDAPPTASTVARGSDHEHQEPQRVANPWENEAAAAERAPTEHSIKQQPDGSTLVDGLFTMMGKGTKESPYEITWDYLMSAAETYQPRLGMNDLPERIKMLDGAHVKIAGFLMFPMASFEAKEALVMLNMWDGCCLGTMPSPYDAIEVQFERGIPASTRQFANYGSVEGKLVVDPYLISDWLIGLYVLEEATLNVGM